MEIDGERAVVACRLGGLSRVSAPGQRPLARMRHGEGNVGRMRDVRPHHSIWGNLDKTIGPSIHCQRGGAGYPAA